MQITGLCKNLMLRRLLTFDFAVLEQVLLVLTVLFGKSLASSNSTFIFGFRNLFTHLFKNFEVLRMLQSHKQARVFFAFELLLDFREVVNFHEIRFFVYHFEVRLF